ncbi:cutinase-domain-containing protein [Mollisia scopiformis]|uniref:Cutinase-domain-containing protein n=1 Tax=Mollisia scopiformis TaxID=149040 RepID=A0A132B339_MOLSC|nr:cutinase-domain-containing protein [Mollisia scopiformis]KUJ06810.1 cutinase-domain-containing protein [Mollisia scopiformis]
MGISLSSATLPGPKYPVSKFAAALPANLPFPPSARSIVIPASNSSSSASNSSSNANTTACATGVHMIVARASTEQPGQGIIGAVATQVQQQLPGSDSEAVDYPATLTDYLNSEASGVAAMTKLVENYAVRCPNSKMALLGYSQGAQVVGDMMCGTSEANFNTTKPISAAASKNIVAIIQMGDPAHMINQPQDVGNSTQNGIFPRNNTATACASMEPLTQSYCNSDDRFCDSGTSIAVHLAYVQQFGTTATKFIIQKVGGNATSTSSGNGTLTGSSTNGTSSSAVPKSDANGFEGVSWGLVACSFVIMLML